MTEPTVDEMLAALRTLGVETQASAAAVLQQVDVPPAYPLREAVLREMELIEAQIIDASTREHLTPEPAEDPRAASADRDN